MKLTLAYSPCPNDTFMFRDIAVGLESLEGREIEIRIHDVETLNAMALEGTYDVTKVSFATWLRLEDHYEMLQAGAALGFGCGPVLVSRRALQRDDLARCRVALPGELTTAHLLLQLWAPQARDKVFVPYDRIIPMVAGGAADCGVIIHEGRFVYAQAGLRCLEDLGEWWERETKLPIPLGGIAARRSLGGNMIRDFEAMLRRAIAHSLAEPEGTWDYVRRHALEMNPDVLSSHVKLFVNEFSLDLSGRGQAAIAEMRKRACAAGVIP